MAKYKIPQNFLKGFDDISELSNSNSKQIAQKLSNISFGYEEEDLAILLRDECDISEPKSIRIASVLFSLMPLRLSEENESLEKFVQNLVQAYISEAESSSNIENLNQNLKLILEADGNLKLTQKARYLQGEYEKVYLESRIISDIRLIYDDKIENTAKHGLVVHQLMINYSHNGVSKKSFFALDSKDLAKLKEVIIRAEQKDEQIIKNTYTKGIKFINFNEIDNGN